VSESSPSSGIEIAPGYVLPEEAVRFAYSRSSGPGGQNVNKVNTRVEAWISLRALEILPAYAVVRLRSIAGRRITKDDELHLVAQVERTQEGNRSALIEKLRELIQQALTAPRPRRATKPSKASKRRRVEGKRHRGEIKSNRRGGWDED
jgi:ribosome-associated protein